ncbi:MULTISPECIES: DUF3050 domain-containing protein [Actinoplanes]|uniref:DUF3050 domain-containing protein n=1 Tax=Actinoplanes TaxID=1865 RepID=UPI0005F2D7B5|nr:MULTISPECIES: DUF3050 domain-containing protein [Actinoplanes]GLY05384.1 hypothetical protein Acsp01_57630 [Actinoplanes sp. NBRC 101535]
MSRYHWALTHPGISRIRAAVQPVRAQVTAHPIYHRLTTRSAVAAFAEQHVYAVWDFMSLLKSLQIDLTGVRLPWRPQGSPVVRRLINDIVLAEESDEINGEYLSHFELYRRAMTGLGADTGPLDRFIAALDEGVYVPEALHLAAVPPAATDFVTDTWQMIHDLPVHSRAAVFAFGREDLIPDMFADLLATDADPRTADFRTYLSRHVELDEEHHTPMAMQMLVDLCADDDKRWRECADAAQRALHARLRLWNAILPTLGDPK